MDRCLRLVDPLGMLRCGLLEGDEAHDPMGHAVWPMEVHPFDGFPPTLPEDGPVKFIEVRP